MKVPNHKTQSSFCVTEFVKRCCLPVDALCMSPLHVLLLPAMEHADPVLSRICKFLCPNVRETWLLHALCICVCVCVSDEIGVGTTQQLM
jgi:hypothetical protein